MSVDASRVAARTDQASEQAAINAECMHGEQALNEIAARIASNKPMIDMPAVKHKVRRVMLFVVQHHRELLNGRHIDQVVLAALYGICKIHLADVTFKDLVEAYKRMPTAKRETYLEVPLLEPGQTGNIIAFYNDVFVPRCKDYLHGIKDATIIPPTIPGYVVHAEHGVPVVAAAGGSAATLTNSPGGFRQSKRARTDDRKSGSEGASGAGSEDTSEVLPAPHSPTRRPREHVHRSPFAEYPASPYKRKAVVTPMRSTVSPARRQVLAGGRAGAGAHASPARAQQPSSSRGLHTPRTAFFHSIGTLGASPAQGGAHGAFDGINDRLKGEPAESGSHVPRAASRPIGGDESRAGASGLDAIASGAGLHEGSIDARPRTLSQSSALLALAQSAATAAAASAAAAMPPPAPVPMTGGATPAEHSPQLPVSAAPGMPPHAPPAAAVTVPPQPDAPHPAAAVQPTVAAVAEPTHMPAVGTGGEAAVQPQPQSEPLPAS